MQVAFRAVPCNPESVSERLKQFHFGWDISGSLKPSRPAARRSNMKFQALVWPVSSSGTLLNRQCRYVVEALSWVTQLQGCSDIARLPTTVARLVVVFYHTGGRDQQGVVNLKPADCFQERILLDRFQTGSVKWPKELHLFWWIKKRQGVVRHLLEVEISCLDIHLSRSMHQLHWHTT